MPEIANLAHFKCTLMLADSLHQYQEHSLEGWRIASANDDKPFHLRTRRMRF
jgi:hypothetical protein